jgi:hypothetical protein
MTPRLPIVLALLLLLLALGALLSPLDRSATLAQTDATPAAVAPALLEPDAFYDPPAEAPAEPGVLLRSEPLSDRVLPNGAVAWRILYTTSFGDDAPALAVATVLAPANPGPQPRPVVAWAHGTQGLLQTCLPSLSTAPFEAVPALDRAVADGWVVVATDYASVDLAGPHPFLIGDGQARSVLDAVRAARQLPELTLAAETVVWGHSQGGHAALWTGVVGPAYAPDVPIAGVAALAPAADLPQLFAAHAGDLADALFAPYVATAYAAFYPDITVDDAIQPHAREAAPRIAALCPFDPEDGAVVESLVGEIVGRPVLADPMAGPLGARLRENIPTGPIAAPVLVAQGLADDLVFPELTDAFVAERCAAGQPIASVHAPAVDHAGIVAPGNPVEEPLVRWTVDRFAGVAGPAACSQETVGAE